MRAVLITGVDAAAAPGLGASSAGANTEYYVPQCAHGTPPHLCTYTLSSVVALDVIIPKFVDSYSDDGMVYWQDVMLGAAMPHLHPKGLRLELQLAETNRTICKVSADENTVLYGDGSTYGIERRRSWK